MSIPKVIHYCWFGGKPLPRTERMCISSWKRLMPDYEIKLWNEDNFDVQSVNFVKQAYEAGKYAFVADYVRCYALCNEGGIYLDADVEVRKPLDALLDARFFTGFHECLDYGVEPAVMASEKGHPILRGILNEYMQKKFSTDNLSATIIPLIITKHLTNSYDLAINGHSQELNDGIIIYSIDYFYVFSDGVGLSDHIPDSVYTVHYSSISWTNPRYRVSVLFARRLGKYGKPFFNVIKKIWLFVKRFIYRGK